MLKSRALAVFATVFILMSSFVSYAGQVQYKYDDRFHRLEKVTRPDGTYTVYSYDDLGNRTAFVATSNAVAPIALFSGSPVTGVAPLTVNFTDQSTGTITSRTWTFGDGSPTSNTMNPSHIYSNAGQYTVSLQVSGPNGTNTKSIANYITVISPSIPSATTDNATSTDVTASLSATVNPHGLITSAWFQYGTTTSYGTNTTSQSLGSGTADIAANQNLSNLSPGTLYHYRIVAQNSAGTVYGNDMTFMTAPVLSSLVINNNAASTTSRLVVLNLSVTGTVTHYMASEDLAFAGASWQIYSASPSFTLSSGNIAKTVYVKVKNDAKESNVVSDSITLNESSGRYTLSNGYIFLSGLDGYIDQLKFDRTGQGNYGLNIINASGKLDWLINDASAFSQAGTTSQSQGTTLTLTNATGTWTIQLNGNDWTSNLSLTTAPSKVELKLDMPYEDSGYYDYATRKIFDTLGNSHDASEIPFKTFYTQSGNTRTLEYFMRNKDTGHYLNFRTNNLGDMSSTQTAGNKRLVAIGTAGNDVDFYGLPSYIIWVDKATDRLTLHSGQSTSDQIHSFSFKVTQMDENEGIDVNENGDKMPYFYTSLNESVTNSYGGVYALDELLNRFYRQSSYYYTDVGLNIWWNWASQYTGFANTWYRDKLKNNISGWTQGDDGYGHAGYMWSWPNNREWPMGDLYLTHDFRHLNTNALFIQSVWNYFAWTGDTSFMNGQLQRVRDAMQYQLSWLGGSTDRIINGQNVYDSDHGGINNEDMGSNYWDILPFGGKDGYGSIDFYNSLVALAQIEYALGNTANGDSYMIQAGQAKTAYNTTFWSATNNRYVGAIDRTSAVHDHGFTFVNIQALAAGLGDSTKATQIYNWLNSGDIYTKWKFAPRSNVTTTQNVWRIVNNNTYQFEKQIQDGGADLYVSGYDLIARARYVNADSAYGRLKGMLSRYSEPDKLTGGSPTIFSETIQGGADGAGSVGIMSHEFPESGFAGASFLYAFIGVELKADGLHIDPKLPTNQAYIGAKNINYRGMTLNFHITADNVRIECTKNTSTGTNFYVINGIQKQFPSGTFVVNEDYSHRTLSVNSVGASGVAITVSPTDSEGQNDGFTPFTRTYNNNTVVTLTAPATSGGNNFSSWTGCDSTSGTGGTICSVTMTAAKTVTATYSTPASTYVLTVQSVNPASGVSITVTPNDNSSQGNGTTSFTRTYNSNTTVTLTAPATSGGNNFSSWTGCNSTSGTGGTICSVTMTAAKTVTATYSTPASTYVLTVNSVNPANGVAISVSPNDNSSQGNGTSSFTRTYNNNTVVTLTAPATSGGNNFSSWSGCNSTSGTGGTICSVTMTAANTVTANYVTPTYVLTLNSVNPVSGVSIIVTPNDNSSQGTGTTSFTRTYNSNTTVTLTAPTTAGNSNFINWTGCDSTSGTGDTICTVTMIGNTTVIANYSQPATLFFDDFNDNSIDAQKWTVYRGGNRVAEEGNIMKLEATVTDQWGYINSQWIDINPAEKIVITRKTLLHHADYFNGNFRIQLDQATNYDFGLFYSDAYWPSAPFCDAHGFFIFKNSSNTEVYNPSIGENNCNERQISPAIPAVWDQWFDEKMIYTPTTGQFEYYINNEKKADFNVGVIPSLPQYKMRLQITPGGWWTGHYHYFDDISVTQAQDIDISTPVVSQVTPVPTPTKNQNPSYTFSSTEAGTVTYGGSCKSATTAATVGNNAITLTSTSGGTLADGTYNNCTITVTDAASNVSSALPINTFTVDTVKPSLTQVTTVPSVTKNQNPSYTFSSTEAGTIAYGGSCQSATTNAVVGSNAITLISISGGALAEGAYSDCAVTVTDAAGNASNLSINTFVVDIAPPVLRLSGDIEPYTESWYSGIQDAYDASSDADDILAWASDLYENLGFNRAISIILRGGCDADFNSVTGFTTVHGYMMISDGTVIIENLKVK